MPRPTRLDPQRGDARVRLLEAARDVIRRRGFASASVDDLCRAAGVTKGAFFHHFEGKQALGVAAADFWSETTAAMFAQAPYHAPADPLDRVLAYIDFRGELIDGDVAEFTCLVGTMAQEVYETAPDIRDACAASILGHAQTLIPDIRAAIDARGIIADWTPESLARHIQAVLQGGFILAKATNDPSMVRESLAHLRRYVESLFSTSSGVPCHD